MKTVSGRAWPMGGTPPMPNPVASRTSSVLARRTGRPRCAARRSVSRRFAPETSARSGSWPAMKTSDLTMRPTVVPTATAACSAVRVLSAHSLTVVGTPAAARAVATFRADGFIPNPFSASVALIVILTASPLIPCHGQPPRNLTAYSRDRSHGGTRGRPRRWHRCDTDGRQRGKGAPLLRRGMVPLEEAHPHGAAVARRRGARGYLGGAGTVDAGLVPVEHLAQHLDRLVGP